MTASAERAPRGPSSTATRPILALTVLAAIYVPLRVIMEQPDLSGALYGSFYVYGTLLQIVLGATVLMVAASIGLKQSVGRQWMLLGTGVALYAIGDVCWTVFDLFLGIDPYPSIADAFYSAEYVFFFAALVLAIRAYSGLVKVRVPVIVGALVALAATAVVHFSLLAPYIYPAGVEELGVWGLVVSILYPVGDVVLMLGPAIALALVVRQLGSGRLAKPWWIVVMGAAVFAVIDSIFVYADWAGLGLTPLMDVGYLAANLLFASAALVARDVYRPRQAR